MTAPFVASLIIQTVIHSALRPDSLPAPSLTTLPPARRRPAYLRNNTPIFSAKGVEVVPFVDGCQTGGAIKLHDSCIDKPTPDNYTVRGSNRTAARQPGLRARLLPCPLTTKHSRSADSARTRPAGPPPSTSCALPRAPCGLPLQ
jgi:hypothetical protein